MLKIVATTKIFNSIFVCLCRTKAIWELTIFGITTRPDRQKYFIIICSCVIQFAWTRYHERYQRTTCSKLSLIFTAQRHVSVLINEWLKVMTNFVLYVGLFFTQGVFLCANETSIHLARLSPFHTHFTSYEIASI